MNHSLMFSRRLLKSSLLTFLMSIGMPGFAAQASPTAAAARVALTGHPVAWARADLRLTTPVDLSGTRTVSVMLSRGTNQAALDQLAAEQQQPGSPMYHKWMTAAQIGAYGPASTDVSAVLSWLSGQGLTIQSVAPTGTFIEASGSLATLSKAFGVSFAYYNVHGVARLGTASMPTVPAALSSVIRGVAGLSDAPTRRNLEPLYTEVSGSTTSYLIAPADFAVIYDVAAVYGTGNSGAALGATPQRVAILGGSGANPNDINQYLASVGLPAANVRTLPVNAPNANYTNDSENNEDADRVLGTAPAVAVDFVLDNADQNPLFSVVSFNTFKLKDPILSISYGVCEAGIESSLEQEYDQLFQVSAMEGITTLVAAGDTGAACNFPSDRQPDGTQVKSINALCASSYVTCVGGTSFADYTNPQQYWAATNGPGLESALSYIPESTWSGPQTAANHYLVESGGGGVSQLIAKPSWQMGMGVPGGSYRVVPDVSFPAVSGDEGKGYYGCYEGTCGNGQGGTSAAAPTMAGVVALLNTALGSASGNINPLLYRLANSAHYNAIFHDVTPASSGVANCDVTVPSRCNNSFYGPSGTITDGIVGYAVTTGYDAATGWGSLDVANFLAAAKADASGTTLH